MPRLEEVTLAITDCEHKTAPTVSDGIPLVRTTNIRRGRIDIAGAHRISEATYREWTRRGEPKPGDLILAREAPVGEVGWVPTEARVCLGQRTVLIRPDPTRVEPRYLLYLLLSQRMQHEMLSRAEGSTTPHLNVADVRTLSLPILPTLREQRAIAGVLGALDDKIELNRRMTETLEAVAEAMYGDLRVSAEQSVPLGQVIELAYGKALKETIRMPGAVPVYGSNGIVGLHNESLVAGPGLIVGRKGNPGVVTWADDDFFPIDTTFYVIPRNDLNLYYLYFALRRLDLPAFAADSAVPGLNRNIAYGLDLELPGQDELKRFDQAVSGFFARRAANHRESRTLAELRDALLPKLISGELRVRDAEAAAEQVT